MPILAVCAGTVWCVRTQLRAWTWRRVLSTAYILAACPVWLLKCGAPAAAHAAMLHIGAAALLPAAAWLLAHPAPACNACAYTACVVLASRASRRPSHSNASWCGVSVVCLLHTLISSASVEHPYGLRCSAGYGMTAKHRAEHAAAHAGPPLLAGACARAHAVMPSLAACERNVRCPASKERAARLHIAGWGCHPPPALA